MKPKTTAPDTHNVDRRTLQGPEEAWLLPETNRTERVRVTDTVLGYLRDHQAPRRHLGVRTRSDRRRRASRAAERANLSSELSRGAREPTRRIGFAQPLHESG
jgi:hypothetical protein